MKLVNRYLYLSRNPLYFELFSQFLYLLFLKTFKGLIYSCKEMNLNCNSLLHVYLSVIWPRIVWYMCVRWDLDREFAQINQFYKKNVMLVALITDLKHFFRFVTLVFWSSGMVRYLMLDHTLPWLPDIIQRGTGFWLPVCVCIMSVPIPELYMW